MGQNQNSWYKLDNTGKLFPSVSTENATNVFRLSARLFEDVKPSALKQAVNQALLETPSFQVNLRKGLFWYYFEHNSKKPLIREEQGFPCRKIDKFTDNGFLFDITYCGKYIHADFFHALCDGTGGALFLKKIISYYVQFAHTDIFTGGIIPVTSSSKNAQREDSFIRLNKERENVKSQNIVKNKAYTISAVPTDHGEIVVIKGISSLSELKAAVKAYDCTITEYLLSVLIMSIYFESFRFDNVNKSIDICVPVNLRQFFKSETIRNFFTTVPVGVNFYKNEYSFEEVLSMVKSQMKDELNIDKITPKVKFCVDKQDNIFLRFVPLFLKNLSLKITFDVGEKGYTTSFSNLGAFRIDEKIEPFVERFEFLLSPTTGSRYKCSACSFKDNFVFCFVASAENTDIQRRFFTMLQNDKINVIISTNNTELSEEDKIPENREEYLLQKTIKRTKKRQMKKNIQQEKEKEKIQKKRKKQAEKKKPVNKKNSHKQKKMQKYKNKIIRKNEKHLKHEQNKLLKRRGNDNEIL